MKRGRREFWLICTALMIWELHGLNMEETYSACRTTCECRYLDEALVVKCRSNKLREVPQEIPENVTELDLSDNDITHIEDDIFRNFTHLRRLFLQNNSIRKLPEGVFDNLRALERLYLKDNLLEELPTFRESLPSLTHLYLDHNAIKKVPSTLTQLTKLTYLNLNFNNISEIQKNAFRTLKHLTDLKLCCNGIGKIEEGAFPDPLVHLNLLHNDISSIPTKALKSLNLLQNLELGGNPIKCIHDYAFDGLHNLMEIDLSWKDIETVEHNAFVNLSKIIRLRLIHVKLTRFPNLTGTTSLKILTLESNAIPSLPEDFCKMFPHLYDFNANMNRIKRIPDMSRCSSLEILKLDYNRITTIGSSLQGMKNIQDITLNGNNIKEIPANVFKGDSLLNTLKLAKNNIISIADTAFVPIDQLEILDLSHNSFPRLPSQGLQNVLELDVRGNLKLNKILSDTLPNVRIVKASYPYHCCSFSGKMYVTNAEESKWNWAVSDKYLRVDQFENSSYTDGEDGVSGFGSDDSDSEGSASSDSENSTSNENPGKSAGTHKTQYKKVNCTPLPDPFSPCNDFMGSWLLRVGVWFVFLLALFGNATVIAVILLSNTKVDVSRFLIMNLAMADFCMGIYLGFLAFVDATTIGSFMHHSVDWQQSHGCQTAGFLALLSSEASVFTLAVITIERFIAIRHALHVHRKMSLRKTAVVMTFGWIMAIVIATLPLYKVSDYTKVSVCLPFETGDVKSLAFVSLILSFNFIAFVIIFVCYVGIYHEIRGSNAWNTNDTQVAMRMALLVVTDFACWAPIVIIAFPAAFGKSFVSLEEAKVFTIFVFPLNSCANPFLYAIFTYQFKKDCVNICRRVKNSSAPQIQITLAKKRTVDQRRGSQGSAIYYPETNSDGRLTLKIPGIRFNRRYSLPAAFKPLQKEKKSPRGSSQDNSQCSNENATEQTTLTQEKLRPLIDRRTAL
ncbi:lutropin-choriogonadotropic hormone receptor-like isoform X2 [Actinia tenebrosa]|uniref:Lutropin-choriogonadotropic hormone receptor-like isoform X2 n=1 Tax=Actinia tenebrosa TaxID=6105 RepID=A0A6P8I5B2_ACTTE|nr:lutropin-choriogonadotropic hormone receptor-like isoform X2 [Actinia tenebrosa]